MMTQQKIKCITIFFIMTNNIIIIIEVGKRDAIDSLSFPFKITKMSTYIIIRIYNYSFNT